jgi:hypothetical protein
MRANVTLYGGPRGFTRFAEKGNTLSPEGELQDKHMAGMKAGDTLKRKERACLLPGLL